MSQENVEIVRKAFDDFNAFMRGELSRVAYADLLDPQIEGDRVRIQTRQSGGGRESGVPFDLDQFLLFTIRDGKVSSLEFFPDHAEALEAAGLRKQAQKLQLRLRQPILLADDRQSVARVAGGPKSRQQPGEHLVFLRGG